MHSAIHDPFAGTTPSQRLAAAAHIMRREKIAASAKMDAPVVLHAPPEAPKPSPVYTMAEWIERQKQIPLPPAAPGMLQIRTIQLACAQYYGVTLADILSGSRRRHFVLARQVGMYLSSNILGQSSLKIGRLFGGRDHVTALWAIRKIGRWTIEIPKIASDIAAIKTTLGVA